jgi:hypothetical protein
MKLDTLEAIQSITLENLHAPIDDDWLDCIARISWSPEMHAAYKLRISSLAPEVDVLVDEVKEQFKANLPTDEAFAKIRALPPKLLLRAWTVLTEFGVDGYDLAKYTHKNMARDVLGLFQTHMPS